MDKNVIVFSTNPTEVAAMLDEYAGDWRIVLEFLDAVAKKSGITFYRNAVVKIMKDKYREAALGKYKYREVEQ